MSSAPQDPRHAPWAEQTNRAPAVQAELSRCRCRTRLARGCRAPLPVTAASAAAPARAPPGHPASAARRPPAQRRPLPSPLLRCQDAWLELGILLELASAASARDADLAEAAALLDAQLTGTTPPPPELTGGVPGAGWAALAAAAAAGLAVAEEERVAPEVLADAELLFEKLRLELLVAA